MSRNNLFGTACKTCRRRGRKCDRSLPTCTSCSIRGVECEGYVLRWVGLAARGSLAGQTSTASDHEMDMEAAQNRQAPRQATRSDVDGVGTSLLAHCDHHDAKVASTAEPPEHHRQVAEYASASAPDTEDRAISIIRQQEWSFPIVVGTTGDNLELLVAYYAHEISTAFYLGEGPAETPYTRHILPMTQAIPSVRCAVAATSACHLGNRLEDDGLKKLSLHLRLKATELLREGLQSDAHAPGLAGLACMLLLAQLDVCSGDCVEFGTHLKAASTFIKARGSDGSEREFIEQRLAWLNIMGATTSSEMPTWTSEDIRATLNKFRTPSGQREWGFDVFYCPIDLFEYIADITFLYKLQRDSQEIDPDTIQRALLLGNAVKRWDESFHNPGPRSHMVEVWRLGILLYLVRLFRLSNDTFEITSLLDGIFHHAHAIPHKTSWSYSTSWPLFHAGLLLPHEDSKSKNWLRNELHTNFRAIGCFNMKRAVETLEQAWGTGDDDIFTFDSQRRSLIL